MLPKNLLQPHLSFPREKIPKLPLLLLFFFFFFSSSASPFFSHGDQNSPLSSLLSSPPPSLPLLRPNPHANLLPLPRLSSPPPSLPLLRPNPHANLLPLPRFPSSAATTADSQIPKPDSEILASLQKLHFEHQKPAKNKTLTLNELNLTSKCRVVSDLDASSSTSPTRSWVASGSRSMCCRDSRRIRCTSRSSMMMELENCLAAKFGGVI